MKTILIVGGIIVLLIMIVFLWLLVAGVDESRRTSKRHMKDTKGTSKNGE